MRPNLARYEEDFYGWPAVAHRMGQFQSVHASGHVHVREQHRNVRTRFQQGYCFVRIARLERHVARFLYDFDGKQSLQRIVLNDEYGRRDLPEGCVHRVNEAKRSGFRRTRSVSHPHHQTKSLPSRGNGPSRQGWDCPSPVA